MPPKKKLSGAQNRKNKKLQQQDLAERKIGTNAAWLSQDAYAKASEQYDPNGPAYQLPVFGSSFPLAVRPVEQALIGFEQGNFQAASLLFDRMTRDDRVSAKAEERIDRLIGSSLEIEPADDSSAALKVSEDLAPLMPIMLPPDQLSSFMMSALGLTVGVAQQVSTRVGLGMRIPSIVVWNNRNMYYNWVIRKLIMITQNLGNIVIEAGDPGWLVWEPYGPWGWLRFGKVRSVSIPWLIRTWCRAWWSRYDETTGMPMRAGIIPIQRDPADEKIFLSQLANIGAEAVIRLPQGEDGDRFDVKLIEASGKGWEAFENLLKHCDDAIAIAWLGQSQSTKGQGGLGTQENAGESTMVRITRKDSMLAFALREQVLKPWAEDNYGNAELAPILKWEFEPPADEKQASEVDLNVSKALVWFKSSGSPINVREYLTERGYPMLTEQEHLAQKKQALEDAQAANGSDGTQEEKVSGGASDRAQKPPENE